LNCLICGNETGNIRHKVLALEGDFRIAFPYLECGKCGCLQLFDNQVDIGKYYPRNYYSFVSDQNSDFEKWILSKRDSYSFFKRDVIGRVINYFFPELTIGILANLIQKNQIFLHSKVLDVGCGNGRLLRSLKELGFSRLYGVDPYLPLEVDETGLTISRTDIFNLTRVTKFDLIIFNHSFEHIQNQLQCLKHTKTLLSKNGLCLIRMPVKTEHVWEKYNVDWVQIDAPRHLILHTVRSFNILLKKTGLTLSNVVFDSTAAQIFNNEQRTNRRFSSARGLSLLHFKILALRRYAELLNSIGQSDQASFILFNNDVCR
jgi:SAM-dependent methyltransferase